MSLICVCLGERQVGGWRDGEGSAVRDKGMGLPTHTHNIGLSRNI